MELILISILGYLIGSVPFAYVIGKVFYQTDVRNHGSGNLGGSNTGRVLGKKAGIAVMTLDLLKVTLVSALALRFSDHPWALACGSVSAAVGHCYPVFLRFRGGKAVATMFGFLFSLWMFAGYSALTFFLPLGVFLIILFLFKIVSLSSILSSVTAAIYLFLSGGSLPSGIAAAVFSLLILIRHRENISRMLRGQENQIRWM